MKINETEVGRLRQEISMLRELLRLEKIVTKSQKERIDKYIPDHELAMLLKMRRYGKLKQVDEYKCIDYFNRLLTI